MSSIDTVRASAAHDLRVALEQLIAVCWRAGRRLEDESVDDISPAAVRRCAIELSLLAEACGVGLPCRSVIARGGDAPDDVLARYRAAIVAPFPRAVQAVLRDHLARLELCLGKLGGSADRRPVPTRVVPTRVPTRQLVAA